MQAQPEELSGDELMEINTRLQNQLNQEKNDMQMKSEELNILIRSHSSTYSHPILKRYDAQLNNKYILYFSGVLRISSCNGQTSWSCASPQRM